MCLFFFRRTKSHDELQTIGYEVNNHLQLNRKKKDGLAYRKNENLCENIEVINVQ